MIDIKDPGTLEHLIDVLTFASENNVADKLLDRLAWLSNYGSGPGPTFGPGRTLEHLAWALTHKNATGNVCQLYKDFAPYSFEFLMVRADGSRMFNGGLIYSGPTQPLDGSSPALTVGIGIDTSTHGWSIHT